LINWGGIFERYSVVSVRLIQFNKRMQPRDKKLIELHILIVW